MPWAFAQNRGDPWNLAADGKYLPSRGGADLPTLALTKYASGGSAWKYPILEAWEAKEGF